jgi:hypothetical protein
MKDETKRSELPPQAKPTDIPEAKVKEGQTRSDILPNLATGNESPAATTANLLGGAKAALPANAGPLTGIMEHLQHQYGNTYVQHLLSEVRGSKADERSQAKQDTPTTLHHAEEIGRVPRQGRINAAGRFSVPYVYDHTGGGDFLPLTLVVPGGVTVAALPLTSMQRNDYRIADPGSADSRAVTIAVSIHAPTPPKMQVTLGQGSFTYVVVFHFRRSSIPPPTPEREAREEGDVEE